MKGQDLAPRNKYVSTQTNVNIPPTEMFSRTAANIVGVPDKEIKVKEPKITQKGPEIDQFTKTKDK